MTAPRFAPSTMRGSIAAMMTPFQDDGSLDVDSLRRLTDWQIEQGSHGVSVGGSTGEPSSQTLAERLRAIEVVAETVDGRVPLLAGTGCARLEDTIELTTAAARAGADAVLVVTPYYARPTQEALRQWYAAVAAAVPDVPVIIYNVPSRTAVDIAPETVEQLFTEVGNIVGIKETTHDFAHFSRVMQRCGPELLVWSGIELLCLPLLALGGAGFISATCNLAPAASAQLFNAWSMDNIDEARRIHFGLHPLVDLLFVETNPAPGKWVLHQRGLIASPKVRPPLVEPSPAAVTRIKELLEQGRDFLSPTPEAAERTGP